MIPSVPDAPNIPPIKTTSSIKNSIGLNLTRLSYPENGGIAILSYQLFMRNVSQGDTEFTMLMDIPYYNNTNNLIVSDTPSNCTFEFFYRAMNQLGPGGNSSIVSYLAIDAPKTPLYAPTVSIAGTNVVIDWYPTPATNYYKVALLVSNFIGRYEMN
jgi:hypothetical protein